MNDFYNIPKMKLAVNNLEQLTGFNFQVLKAKLAIKVLEIIQMIERKQVRL